MSLRAAGARRAFQASRATVSAGSANACLHGDFLRLAAPDAGAVELAGQVAAEIRRKRLGDARTSPRGRCRCRRRARRAPAARPRCTRCRWRAARTGSRRCRRPNRRSGGSRRRYAATTLATPSPRVSCTCSDSCSIGTAAATSAHMRGDVGGCCHADGVGDADLGDTARARGPRRARRRARAQPSPSNGHPKLTETATSTVHSRSRASSTMCEISSSDSSTLRLTLRRLKESVAAMVTSTLRTPWASASSSPRRLGTSTRRRARSPSKPASTAAASASCGTQRGETNDVASTRGTPASSSPRTSRIFAFGGDGVGDVLEAVARSDVGPEHLVHEIGLPGMDAAPPP